MPSKHVFDGISYTSEHLLIERAYLADKPASIHDPQLRKERLRSLAVHHPNSNAKRMPAR